MVNFAILGIFLGGVWVVSKPYSGALHGSRLVKNLGIVKSLILACRAYASDSEGKFPASLEALYPDYVDSKELFLYDDGHTERARFLYYAGGIASDPFTSEIIIVSPHPSKKGKRIVGFADGHVGLFREDEYQEMRNR